MAICQTYKTMVTPLFCKPVTKFSSRSSCFQTASRFCVRRFVVFVFVFLLCAARTAVVTAQTNGAPSGQETFSVDIGVSASVEGAGAYYTEHEKFEGGFDSWVNAHIQGDLGSRISYFADIGFALLYAPRAPLEKAQVNVDKPDTVDVYSNPRAYFPYTYRSGWGGYVFPLSALHAAGPTGWADSVSIGANVLCEISGSALSDRLQWRAGRTEREAAAMTEGSSLVLNKFAQPFFGIDMQFEPVPWLGLYSLSGILEYFSSEGIQKSSREFQNAFSLSMVTARYKNYLQIDIGSTAVWPKRFELGYLFPLMPPLFYQNALGDFDNVGLFGNIKIQKPGLGFVWFSAFVDEMGFEKEFFKLDREMYAFQFGLQYVVPFLSFSSLTVSYTKIEPYCYTHQKVKTPWYDEPIQQAAVNHGYGLGYYLPPNSDELKISFVAMTSPQTAFNALFQMIRHGADYGYLLVDGSSYESELAESERSTNPKLKKDFLNDGAYQWQIVLKLGFKHGLKNFPLEFSFETGMAYSFWMHAENIIDDAIYPTSTGIIAHIGAKIFY